MSETSVVPFPEKVNSIMPESCSRFRICHTEQPHWYWSVASIWGVKAEARIYTDRERNIEPLPDRGLWERVVEDAPVDVSDGPITRPYGRSLAAQMIGQILLSQHCREEQVQLRRLNELSPNEQTKFIAPAEFIVNRVLSPDRFEAALMALADTFCGDGDGVLNIFQVSRRTQQHYYELAVCGMAALEDNVKEVPSDWHYRDQLSRLVDAVAPKKEPEPNAHVHPVFQNIFRSFGGPKGGL